MATLTTVKGVNRTIKENVPQEKLDVTQSYGKLRVLYDSYVIDAADEIGTSGLVRLFDIPKGARLISCEVGMPASGATGTFDLGWAASEELDSSGTTVEAADADGIIAQADPGGAALEGQKMPASRPGYMKLFAGAVEVQADFSEITADSGGDTLEVTAFIVVD